MTKLLVRGAFFLWFILGANQAFSHAMAPSSLKINKNSNVSATLAWKQPIQQVQGVRLTLDIRGCNVQESPKDEIYADSVIQYFEIHCLNGFELLEIDINGLKNSNTYVIVEYLDSGHAYTNILDSSLTVFKFSDLENSRLNLSQFLSKGIKHLIMGYDHVLFVVGLLLLLKNRVKKLVIAISCFTIGHAISLGVSASGFTLLESIYVESLILLSLIWLALEVVSPNENIRISVKEKPYLLTLVFGVVHGLGFAGILMEFLQDKGEIWKQVFAFNIGVEIGQLLVVALVLPLLLFADKWVGQKVVNSLAGYSIGGASFYWLLVLFSS